MPSAEELAKLAQNPVANLIRVPFPNNTNFDVGPGSGTQNIAIIQPVVPFSLGADWNLVRRTIRPLITRPGFTPDQGSATGPGDMQLGAYYNVAKPDHAADWQARFQIQFMFPK